MFDAYTLGVVLEELEILRNKLVNEADVTYMSPEYYLKAKARIEAIEEAYDCISSLS